MYYQINSPNVVREFFDGEFVVVNLETGTYFSLEKSGALIWALLEDGSSVTQAVDQFAAAFSRTADEAKPLVENFINTLIEHALVVERSASHTNAESVLAQIIVSPADFGDVSLKKYTDMQDLLLLDPIHDADEAGWPLPKQANSGD